MVDGGDYWILGDVDCDGDELYDEVGIYDD